MAANGSGSDAGRRSKRTHKAPSRYDEELADGLFSPPILTKERSTQSPLTGPFLACESHTALKTGSSTKMMDADGVLKNKTGRMKSVTFRADTPNGIRGNSAGIDSVSGASESTMSDELTRRLASLQSSYKLPETKIVHEIEKQLIKIRKELALLQPLTVAEEDLRGHIYHEVTESWRPRYHLFPILKQRIESQSRGEKQFEDWLASRELNPPSDLMPSEEVLEFKGQINGLDGSAADSSAKNQADTRKLHISDLHPTLATAILSEIIDACNHDSEGVFGAVSPEEKNAGGAQDQISTVLEPRSPFEVVELLLGCNPSQTKEIRELQRREYYNNPSKAVRARDLELAKRFLGENMLPPTLVCDYMG